MILAGYMVSRWMSVCLSVRLSVFCFRMMSKYQWIFTKLGMFIDIVEIWFGIANGQILSILTELSARDSIMVRYYSLTFSFLLK